ncbi:MAG: hypothetical protein WBG71_04600 [Leeuwenhoekiella sp.]
MAISQKTISKNYSGMSPTGILVESDEIFKITVTTSKTDEIILKTKIDGETFETFEIKTSMEDSLLVIRTGRALGYKKIDDKLAAHKVMSVELIIEMPQDKELYIDSDLASVALTGRFRFINLNLLQGYARLNHFRGSGTINTKGGYVTARVFETSVDARTNNGKVIKEVLGNCPERLKIHSIDGNIAVFPLQ